MERGPRFSRKLRTSVGLYLGSEENTIRKNLSLRGEGEARHVEHRVIGHGQAVERQHAEHGEDPAKQDRHLKRHDDERGPGVIRPAADVHRITDNRNPVLHEVAAQAAEQGADQHHQRNFVAMEADGFRQALDRERAIGVDLLVAGLAGAVGRIHQRIDGIEFGHDPVDLGALHSLTSASGSRVRISKIEIMGRMRTNRNMQARKKPMVPMKVIQSHRVG